MARLVIEVFGLGTVQTRSPVQQGALLDLGHMADGRCLSVEDTSGLQPNFIGLLRIQGFDLLVRIFGGRNVMILERGIDEPDPRCCEFRIQSGRILQGIHRLRHLAVLYQGVAEQHSHESILRIRVSCATASFDRAAP